MSLYFKWWFFNFFLVLIHFYFVCDLLKMKCLKTDRQEDRKKWKERIKKRDNSFSKKRSNKNELILVFIFKTFWINSAPSTLSHANQSLTLKMLGVLRKNITFFVDTDGFLFVGEENIQRHFFRIFDTFKLSFFS